jgi:hypothetical protein
MGRKSLTQLFFIQALKDKFAKMLSTQNGQHQKEMAQLEVNFWGFIH